jgi:tetratricopeptide (TPR) repeat protein
LESKLVFVNPNHLSGFVELTAFAGLGFGVRSHDRGRLLWLMAFAVSTTGVFLSLSRGGIAGFCCGLTLFLVLSLRRAPSNPDQRGSWRLAFAAAAVAIGLGVAAYLALDPILRELATLRDATHDTKLGLWPLALQLIRQFPLAGIGRGSFATVFTAYKLGPEPVTFTHLENEWLQAPIDLGLVVGLALIASAAFTWWSAAKQRDLSRPEIGALAGLASLALHDTVDFSLELLGVALPFALMLGLLSRHRVFPAVGRLAQRAGAAAALALATLGMTLYVNHPTEDDALRVAAAPGADAAVALAREAARWHPADFVPQATAGIRLVQEGRCAEALPWLTRAMLLDPTGPETHLHAARCLAAGKRDAFARQEYRLAFLMGDLSALAEAARRYPSVADLLQIAPDTPQGLAALGALLVTDHAGDAALVYQRSWDAFGDIDALAALAQLALMAKRDDEALRLARTLREKSPDSSLPYLVGATALRRLGRTTESQQELELGAARLPGSAPILNVLSQRAMEAHRYSEAQNLADRIVTGSPIELAHKKLLLASVLSTQGRTEEAVAEALGAQAALPQEPWTHLSLAAYLAQAGRHDEAIAAVERAAGLPDAPAHAYEERLQELRRARDAQRLRLLERDRNLPTAEAPRLP